MCRLKSWRRLQPAGSNRAGPRVDLATGEGPTRGAKGLSASVHAVFSMCVSDLHAQVRNGVNRDLPASAGFFSIHQRE